MHTVMPRKGLEEIFDKVTRDVTERVAGISLCREDTHPTGNLCTVYVAFERGVCTGVSFCAEEALFVRLTRYMMQEEEVTPQDVEDFTKEYFNMLCGYISGQLFQATKISSRFGIPYFYRGRFMPEGHEIHFAINYTSDENERAQLVHHMPEVTVQN